MKNKHRHGLFDGPGRNTISVRLSTEQEILREIEREWPGAFDLVTFEVKTGIDKRPFILLTLTPAADRELSSTLGVEVRDHLKPRMPVTVGLTVRVSP